jgi:hypothetical protein
MRKFAIYFAILFFFLSMTGCATRNWKEPLGTVQAPNGQTLLLAVYQPWFGQHDHINVGYSSQDPNVLRKQIARAKELNINGFVVNWYGPRKEFEDRSYALLQSLAGENDFRIAVQYDEAVDHPGYATDAVIVDLQYVYDKYISPGAGPSRAAYLRYNGRPVIFIFPKDASTDWNRVREALQGWPEPPLLIYKDQSSQYPNAFDGFYPWVQPGKAGWAADGKNWGEDYLSNFYNNMVQHHPDKIAVGAVWPGFDDSRASWSRNRHMANRCGRTLEDGFKLFRRYFGAQHAPPFLLIETWNDYEEGTAIESGVNHCNDRRDPVSG